MAWDSVRAMNSRGDDVSSPPARDAASLKALNYGPGHEKFPSWPGSCGGAAAIAGGGGSHRSKSWTDHTSYLKEKVAGYTRPHMKRANSAFTQQLKTVMERCEKIPPEMFESRSDILDDSRERMYLPRLDREGKTLGDNDYMVPSPPERDIASKPQLTQADLEEYARSYQDPALTQANLEEYVVKPQQTHLTRAELEEYSRTYDDALQPTHQQQPSYAQSEGYHSYVSSTDSTTNTPFLDRLRRDSEIAQRPVPGPQTPWSEEGSERERPGRDSVVTTSSGSASSSETLKWHGSLSDVSVASSSCAHSRQLIAHSARVQTPQRHHSESVLYLGSGDCWVQRNNNHNKLRLFPVNTYTVQPQQEPQSPGSAPAQASAPPHRLPSASPQQSALSVAERISELEKQQLVQTRYTYLDPDKRHRVSDPTLKAIQKKALLSFYERHHSVGSRSQAWRSEPQLAQPTTMTACPQSPPPQPPPRPRPAPSVSSRRASSASDYAGSSWREVTALRDNSNMDQGTMKDVSHHQHSSSCGSLSTDLLGPLIVGPSICVDDWVPERPPKKPHLRAAFPPPVPDRMPSPDLPPPSPPTVLEDEVFNSDEPLPPPPPELAAPDWTANTSAACGRNTSAAANGSASDCTSTNVDSANMSSKHEGNGVSTQKYAVAHQKHPESQVSHKKTENSALPVNCSTSHAQPTPTNNLVYRHSDNVVQDQVANSEGSLSYSENNNHFKVLENSASNTKYSDNKFSTAFRQSDTSFMNHVPNNRHGGNSQRHHWSSNFVQRSLDSVTSSQRYLENGPVAYDHQDTSLQYQRHNNDVSTAAPVQRHHANAHSPTKYTNNVDGLRYPENGFISSRYKYGHNNQQKLQHEDGPPNQKQLNANIGATNPKNGGNGSVYKSDCKTVNKGMHKPLENGFANGHGYVGPSVFQRHGDVPHTQNNSSTSTSSQPYRSMNVSFMRFSSMKHVDHSASGESSVGLSRFSDGARASLRYPTQKLMVNGKLATSLSEWAPVSNVMSRGDGNRGSVRLKNVMEPCRARLQKVPAVQSSKEVSQPLLGSQNTGRISEPARIPMVQSNKELSQASVALHCYSKVVESARVSSLQNNKEVPQPVLTPHSCSRVLDSTRVSLVQSNKVSESGRVPLMQSNKEVLHSSSKVPESSKVPSSSLVTHGPNKVSDSSKLSSVQSSKEPCQSSSKDSDSCRVSCVIREVPQPQLVVHSSNKVSQSTRVPLVLSSSEVSQPVLAPHNSSGAPESTKVPSVKSNSESSQPLSVPSSSSKLSPRESPTAPSPADENLCSGANTTLTEDHQSTSKASSYLAHRRDRERGLGLPNYEGSYKRTMSPSPADREVADNTPAPLSDCDRVASCISLSEKTEDTKSPPSPLLTSSREIQCVVAAVEEKTVPDTDSECGEADRTSVASVASVCVDPVEVPAVLEDSGAGDVVHAKPQVTECLQLVQRSEVVLRVNAATSDASSQTELDKEVEEDAEVATPPCVPRHKLQEEIDCERLSLDLASHLSPSDRLQGILVPGPDYKKVTDYVSGLFRLDIPARSRALQRPVASGGANSLQNGTGPASKESDKGDNSGLESSPLPANSAYFTTSESKAKFLTRYGRDMSQSEQVGAMDLHKKKEELMSRLDRKLEVLREEHLLVTEECRINDELGESVAGQVSRLARPHETAKYRLHVEEVGKITSLLLGLSGRLARAENALVGLPDNHAEKKILESKRDKLKEQLDEAKKLKENIDRRSVQVSKILYKYFNEEEYADYDHFINMKAKLIMDSREIADKIKLGEEQLVALKETLTTPD